MIEPTTPRLRLRQWQERDRAPFAQLNADPQVMEFFPHRLDRAASDAMVDRLAALIQQQGWGLWAMECLADQEFIGFVGLNTPSVALPIASQCQPPVEVGWRLARPFWGQGYATEAAQAALQVGFNQLALPEIISFTALDNRRSQAVMQRLGMERDAETFLHPGVPAGHPLQAHCLYRLGVETWRAQTAEILP
ncbi:MAG: GNAT family N-acetyltransferase [Cyanobacteria bacterium P01_G01_bin.54]